MATPLLIDTDMGVDDAVAISLILASESCDVRGIVGVGGNVALDQVMKNIGGLLQAIQPPHMPVIGRGLDPASKPGNRQTLFGTDGLGECDLAAAEAPKAVGFKKLYGQAIKEAGGELVVLAMGPLSNLAAVCGESPELAAGIKHVHLTGGAVWTRGDINEFAEFNFHRDPPAAAAVLTSGAAVTVTPLDVTRLICLDESHVARMAASGYRTGEVLAKALRHSLDSDSDPGMGKSCIPDAVTAGSLLWPNLFLRTQLRLDVTTTGPQSGRSRPALGGDASSRVDLLTAVNAADFIENLLESLCHEAFVV